MNTALVWRTQTFLELVSSYHLPQTAPIEYTQIYAAEPFMCPNQGMPESFNHQWEGVKDLAEVYKGVTVSRWNEERIQENANSMFYKDIKDTQ